MPSLSLCSIFAAIIPSRITNHITKSIPAITAPPHGALRVGDPSSEGTKQLAEMIKTLWLSRDWGECARTVQCNENKSFWSLPKMPLQLHELLLQNTITECCIKVKAVWRTEQDLINTRDFSLLQNPLQADATHLREGHKRG